MQENEIQVKTDTFSGPLGLLLLLIQNQDLDIHNLNMNDITEQYLDYLSKMKFLNFDEAGDYLLMAATLLYIKSKTCLDESINEELLALAQDSEVITTKADLVKRLLELSHFQKLGQKIWGLPKLNDQVFIRPKINKKNLLNNLMLPMDLSSLTLAYADFLYKQGRVKTVIERDPVSIKSKLRFMKSLLKLGETRRFSELLKQEGIDETHLVQNKVVTFISLLELTRLQKISVLQPESYSEIFVDTLSSLEDFDVNLVEDYTHEEKDQKGGELQLGELPLSKDHPDQVSIN